MSQPTFACRDEQRRHQVRRQKLNGLDYLEVNGGQTVLCVHFLGDVPRNLTANHLRIEGGQRIRDIQVVGQPQIDESGDLTLDSCLRITLNKPGDFSTYILRLVEQDEEGNFKPLTGFDPRYAQLPFTFKSGCQTDLDCKSQPVCLPEERIEPEINYLAKDYASFRQLILDRLSLLIPDWKERHIPDLGIALVELLAYIGDHLSYYQDAVATEAYLQTARQRISVRRHVRLIDYLMHDGSNARTWVWIDTDTSETPLKLEPQGIFFITAFPGALARGAVLNQQEDLSNVSADQYEVFEPVANQPIRLYAAHSKIRFYTWGERQCCLPKGAMAATLLDGWVVPTESIPWQPDPCDDDEEPSLPQIDLQRRLQLKVGDILIFEEVKGAKTGNSADADPAHRHAVRLTRVEKKEDELYKQCIEVQVQSEADKSRKKKGKQTETIVLEVSTPIIEIEWAEEDALPFPLCITALGPAPECELIEDITLVRGNVILVDHGRTVTENLTAVQEKEAIALCESVGQPSDITFIPEPFHPHLKQVQLTFRQPVSSNFLIESSASKLVQQEPRGALPQIYLTIPTQTSANAQKYSSATEPARWIPSLDLLDGHAQTTDIFWNGQHTPTNLMQRFIVEMDNDGVAHLRFGDGQTGLMPEVGTTFHANYRIGNGSAGNIGAETITHLVFRNTTQSGVKLEPHNPFPAKGGIPPEPLSEVKLFAPGTFRKDLQRAITPQDYADLVMRDFKTTVQRAAAVLRWMGSWYEVLVVVDPRGAQSPKQGLLDAIEARLYRYRRMGHDLVVRAAVYVPLAIALHVCVLPNYLRGHIKATLLDVFSNRRLPDGRLGFFHPDNLTFGGGIYLSQLIATAQAVPGVMSVTVTRLKRLAHISYPSKPPDPGEPPGEAILNGVLLLETLEIAQLDNDPSFPENGVFQLDVQGGR